MCIFPKRWGGREIPTYNIPKFYIKKGFIYETKTNKKIMKTKEEKQAFPNTIVNANGVVITGQNGMSLRDYFANSAMQAPTSYKPCNLLQWLRWAFGYTYKGSLRPHNENAIKAYELADAMLKQREL